MTTGQIENLLPSLEIVDLTSNVCINEKFSGRTEIRVMISSINASCQHERQKSNSSIVLCEKISRSEYGIVCTIGTDTEISSQDCVLTSTDFPRIQSISIYDYKQESYERRRVVNVRYLPIVNRFTRNLIEYQVGAAVRVIGKENFEGMIWLERLNLGGNLIETIPEETFQGLVRLQYIDLGKELH